MDPFEPRLVLKKEVRFSECLAEETPNPEEDFGDVFGGIIKSGQWGWLTRGSHLRITSLRTGQLISKFEFDNSNGFGVCFITCVSEIQLPFMADTIIAIGIQYADGPGGLAVIYSIEESTVLRCIELKHKITCCKFISHEASQHTVLQNMNGCLAVGTDGGSVLLVDLNLQHEDMNATLESDVSVVPCHIVDYSMSLLHLHRHFQHCQQEGVHFGIQLEVLENAKFIQSLLPIDLILSLAVGLSDGRLALYDLTDMQVFYVASPQERSSPLVKMNFMEPPDDPRPCVYIWAFHENYQNSMAVMHSLMYEKRVVAEDGFCYFENFQISCVRLLLPLNTARSVPITCQAITKAPSHGNEETISLCALVWKQDNEVQTEVLLFDINQWYKEEMPYVGDWREDPSYLASFVLAGLSSLEMYFNPNTISLFNSIQRPEEHFYPVSLSFDSIALGEKGCVHLNWPGAQNRVINVLRSKGSLALLDPNMIFNEVLNTRLLPQFSGLNYKSTFSLKAKRETLLSVAIEQNCIGLLKDCARNWSDGSHQGRSLTEGLSMSILTDWLWARASNIKERCNTLCQVLFDHSGCTLDQREQKELGYISKQLKTLADLLSEIILRFSENIPSDVVNTLESQGKLIRMASDYQEILLWLLNIGLLPEGSRMIRNREVQLNLVPYPYESLKRFYENRRMEFTRLNEKFASRKTRSCYLLFIDSFIEHEFKGNTLRDSWQESGGDGLYPPTSIQAMLRIMLIPDVTFDNKCALFLYFFLDLNMAIEDKRYEPIVQNFIKFPSVFKLSASLIKQIQAFWNLDHSRFQAAVDEFISPFNKDQVCPQWQLELFLESLLAQSEANLALRVLEAKSSPISPVLQLNTYLANDLVSEAFHFARSKQDEDLLKLFFTGCLCTGKFGVIRDLALTESEGNLVQSLLKNSKSRNAENLHFVYLLQKYKYIEAVSYLDELSKGRAVQRAVDVDTPTLVLSAYNTTMTPVTKGLSDVYFKIKNKIKTKESEQNSPYPLSCQLIKQNANDLLGGIYHSSALSAHFASHYWERHHSEGNTLQQSTNAPFLRRPQIPSSYAEYNQKESISYPDPYKAAQKRRLDKSPVAEEIVSSKIRENPKKRRKIYDRSDFTYKSFSREPPTADNLLTQFKNTPTHSQDISSFTKKLQTTPQRESPFFLETPYVKNTSTDNSSMVTRSRIAEKTGTSLQGILKGSHSNRTDEVDRVKAGSSDLDKRDRKDTEEEKSIRFILPSVEDESEDQKDEDSVITEEIEVSPQNLRKHTGPAKRKSLRSFSSYIPTVRSAGSRSPLKKDMNKEERPTSGNVQFEYRKNIFEHLEKGRPSNVSVSPINVAERPSALRKIEIEEPSTVTKGSASITESRASLRVRIEDSAKQPITRMSVSPSSVAGSRPSLGRAEAVKTEEQGVYVEKESSVSTPKMSVSPRASLREVVAKEIEQQTSPDIPMNLTEPKWILQNVSTGDSEYQSPEKLDTTGNVRIIPVVRLDENYSSQTQLEFEDMSSGTEPKQSKRALSESADDDSNESTHYKQRSAKQLKCRVSIHSSSSDISEHKTPTSSESYMQTKSDLQDILRSDTIIDFKPFVSSSRLCATESELNVNSETDPEFHSDKLTSKATFSERSTVVGGLSYMPTLETIQHLTDTVHSKIQPKNRMLDTTVDMTLYDTLTIEQSHQQQSNDDSNSLDLEVASDSSNQENDQTSEKSENENNDDSDSVILLSSRSSSQTFNGNGSGNSNSRPSETATKQIVIEDEEDDEDSDGIDIIEERFSDESEDCSNSYSNKFSEVSVSRTSTSYSIPSNTDTVLSSTVEVETEAESFNIPLREVEEGEDNEEILKEESPTTTSKESEICYVADKTTKENTNLEQSTNERFAIEEESTKLNLSATTDKNDGKETLETRTALVTQITEIPRQINLHEEDKETIENVAKRVKLSEGEEESHPEEQSIVVSEQNVIEVIQEEEKIEKTDQKNKSHESNSENKEIEEKIKSQETTVQNEDTQPEENPSEKVVNEPTVEDSTPNDQGQDKEKQQNVEEDLLTPNPRGRRSKSITKAHIGETDVAASPLSRRQSRGGSMPPTMANPIVTRRRSMLLETLDENLTPDSPSSRTRSKLRTDSIDGEVDSPSVSNIKRNRLSSVSSVEHPQTPKSRRRSTTSVDKELSNTPKSVGTPRTTRAKSITTEVTTTPIKTPRRLSISKKDISPSDQSSQAGSNSRRQTTEEEVTEHELSQSDDYKSSRRLTRTQLAVLEKSAALSKPISISPMRVTRRRASRASEKDSPPMPDVKGSDNESLSSRLSHRSNSSSRRVTRSSALKEASEDDIISVASSTESGRKIRKRTKEVKSPITPLTAIPEEEGSEGSVANSETSKRSRRQRK